MALGTLTRQGPESSSTEEDPAVLVDKQLTTSQQRTLHGKASQQHLALL